MAKTDSNDFLPLEWDIPTDAELKRNIENFRARMFTRRSVRAFSDREVDPAVLRKIVEVAASAPSGANKQPWFFAIVTDPGLKREIRTAAEAEEKEFYTRRAPHTWLEDLEPLGTSWEKPYLETAPALIVVFKRILENPDQAKRKNYYVTESVGIACGFLFAAIHMAGLVALPHTPSPMNFLSRILQRPAHEKPFLLVPVGHPAPGTQVPRLTKKSFDDIAQFF
ncbi:MAG: nitroreductase family protein [Candidatus Neomarinimicrobiota bacterium]|nr:MAG: nitroreductase family protein [Candidatus Neomarinimicrobiota bacterium]